jgi:hypothetical protein
LPAKDAHSKPDKSKKPQPPQKPVGMLPLDKVYWTRLGIAVVAGITSGATVVLVPQPLGGLAFLIIFYLFSVLVARALVGERIGSERQLYTQGLGTFLILWFMFFSLYVTFFYPNG